MDIDKLEHDYFLLEKQIISEKLYDWKKHFIHQLPEMLYFLLRWCFYFLVAQILLTTLALSAARAMVEFSSTI
jgi:hypothetical protein